jgi:hypothetical protein
MSNTRVRGRLDNDLPSFSEWIERYERQQTEQSQQISSLTKDVSSLSADVRSLIKNQEALFNKTSRPFQWSAFIAAIALVATSAALLITPMKDEDSRHREFDQVVMRSMLDDAREMGEMERDIEWLKKLEQRSNERLHQAYKSQ